jgi:hypothetical protein
MPTPTYRALANITLGSSASSVTFSSIPATFRDLVLVYAGTQTNASGEIWIRYNSDTGSNYSTVQMGGLGSGSGFSTSYTTTRIVPTANQAESTTVITNIVMSIFDYSATDKHKTSLVRANNSALGTQAQANRWANTAAITTVEITTGTGQLAAGSTFALYGIAS